ncbi:Polyisoprenoid-binding protein YceI [Salinimicrobium sediminis]|uniref:Polyisoprenoid-binding protein YceI n=1 Tax=Salinimicrobium sediminis TaxID=1343891 RepID=A0A285X004_9FLAO|nr:YceI family protein [Salinimicrobium sediminis]SOC78628.1 Polyisoprenoid-binding protein YceI [Salinimicrobium sediminis]
MKKRVLNFVVVAGVTLGSVACKDDKSNKVEPGEAQEAAVATEEAVTYEIDTTASTIEWRGTKPTGEHKGTIAIQDGTLSATQEEITSGSVTIDMNSIEVTDEGMDDKDRTSLENHLKGTVEGKETDFFNVKEYPTASFEITGVTEENGQKMLQGNLTLKDSTKNIQFPVSTDIDEEEITLESETFTIDRTNWGVNYGSKSVFDNLGDNFISDEMELTIKVTAKRAQ